MDAGLWLMLTGILFGMGMIYDELKAIRKALTPIRENAPAGTGKET